jgi:hypothetical protein
MGTAAAGAIIRFMLAVYDVITTLISPGDNATATRFKDTRRHTSAPFDLLAGSTSNISEEFHGAPMNEAVAHPHSSLGAE